MSQFMHYAARYRRTLADILDSLDPRVLERLALMLDQARQGGHTVFVAGNGGSASTAEHLATDLMDVHVKAGGKPLRALSLNDNAAMFSALANDFGYERVFADQLAVHYRPGDCLVVISASGNSPNVVAAARWVLERGGQVAGLLGFDGGTLSEICPIAVVARSDKGLYGPVEDVHVIIGHLLSAWLKGTALPAPREAA